MACAVYLNRIYRERNCPEKPEDPLILEKDIPYDADFTFIDFVPSVLAYSSQEVEYHRFSHLVETANSWLHRNVHWKLVNCETVKLSYRHNLTNMVSRWEQQINPATAMWNGSQLRIGEYETSLKVLRLWIRRRDIDEDEVELTNDNGQFVTTLRHLDFVPQRGTGNVFESVDEVLKRVNERLQESDAAKWNMISLQSLKVEANSDWNLVDPEVSLAEESSRHLIVLRLFYEVLDYGTDLDRWLPGTNQNVTIGVEDFKPRLLSGGSFFKRPQFEPFASLVHRAAKWLTNQVGVHFMNVQSLDIKVKSLSKIESRSSTHIEHGDYIQMLRVVFIRYKNEKLPTTAPTSNRPRPRSAQSDSSRSDSPSSVSLILGSKVILTTKYEHPLDSLQQRIHNWLRADSSTEICVLSAETVDIYGKDDDERNLERMLEDCFQSNRLGSLNMYAFSAVRLFYYIVPREDKSALTKSTLSLSAVPTAKLPNQTPRLLRQESATVIKRQRWARNITQDPTTVTTRGTPKLRHQHSGPQLVVDTTNTTTTTTTVVYQHKSVLNRRPTAQFDCPMSMFGAELTTAKFDDRMRPRSSSTSCNCM